MRITEDGKISCPPLTADSLRTGWWRRRLSWSLTSLSFAFIRFDEVTRCSLNRPFRDFAQNAEKVQSLHISPEILEQVLNRAPTHA